MWTKKQIIVDAFCGIGIIDILYDSDATLLQYGLRQLDNMMSSWEANKISLGYLLPSSPDASSIDDYSGLPDYAVNAVINNLSISLANSYGKQVSQDLSVKAHRGLEDIKAYTHEVPVVQLDRRLPLGQGNKNFTFAPDTSDITNDLALDF